MVKCILALNVSNSAIIVGVWSMAVYSTVTAIICYYYYYYYYYEESVWMKIRSERGREALYIGCVYMPTDSTSISVMDSCYERLKEDVLSFREKGKVVLFGDFNARVGSSAQLDDVVGMFGENTCNASGN